MRNGITIPRNEAVTAPIKNGLPRLVEAVIALVGLVIVSPLIALAAIAIAITSRGPVIFHQNRMGRKGRPFVLYKMRTMCPAGTGPQVTAGDDARVTTVGKILRKTKLDEFPELWNIVKGDMSLIGPRPEVPRYVDLENPMWRLVLEARPGITDPMTLRLRNEESLMADVKGDRERFYLETLQPFKLNGYADYLQTRSWWSDLKVLWQTAVAVVLPNQAPLPTLEEIKSQRRGSEYVAPHTEIEEIVAGIWATLLGVPQVGRYDNFFHLGGHSLLATQVVSRVRNAFGVEMGVRSVFEAATVAALGRKIEEAIRASGLAPHTSRWVSGS